MTTLEFIGEAEDYLAELAVYWESLELDIEWLSHFTISVNGTTRWGQVIHNNKEYIIHGITDSRGRMTLNVSVPDDEADLWRVPLTSGNTSEHEATRGTLTLPTINTILIVAAKTPIATIDGHPKLPVDPEAPDAPSPPEWIQPLGEHDAYDLGDLTIHNSTTWISLVPANVWEPGVASWREVTESGELPAWVQPSGAHDAYAIGAEVTHNGQDWVSTVAANVWEPGVFGWDVIE